MTVKVALLKSGEDVISDIEEMMVYKRNMDARIKSANNKKNRLLETLSWSMEKFNSEKVVTPEFTISFRNNPPKVVISDDDKIHSKYINVSTSVNKSLMADDLKKGIPVSGAYLEKTKSLSIR